MTIRYAFCESSAAGSLTPWHIRTLTRVGKKTSGGIDTESLCGRITAKFGGWDLEAEVENYPLDNSTDGRRHICKKCADKYRALTTKGTTKPIVTLKEATDKCCELLNGLRVDEKTRWPASYQAGNISTKHETERYSVTVDVDPYIQGGRMGWKVRVSSNATQLKTEEAEAFSKLYLEAVRVARIAQTFMDSVEIDLKTL